MFHDGFWSQLDCMLSAVDGQASHQAVENFALLHDKATIESGMQGTKGHVQVILPHKSATPSDTPDELPEAMDPSALRNFPSQPVHCIEWARDCFNAWFVRPFDELRTVVHDPAEYSASLNLNLYEMQLYTLNIV